MRFTQPVIDRRPTTASNPVRQSGANHRRMPALYERELATA
jgi:hypothetical protein